MPVRLKDIAQEIGVSASTVSRALHDRNQKYKISEDVRNQIINTAKDMGYSPNQLARGLKLKKSLEIGIVVPDISNPFFAMLVKNIARHLQQSGYSMSVYDSDETMTSEKRALQLVIEKRVDGIILASVGLGKKHIQELIHRKIPVVMVDRCIDDIEVDSVSVDNTKGAYLATTYLIKEGHRKIAFIQGLHGTYSNERRLEGYRQALKESAVQERTEYILGDDFRTLNGFLETKTLLSIIDPPTAIFTAGDLIALGALQAIKEAGLKIPKDISILTFDDPMYTNYLSPPMTAVAQPIDQMGEIAVKLIVNRINGSFTAPRKILLDPQLIVRESVSNYTSQSR
jgi:LacI family transcriptional regulator